MTAIARAISTFTDEDGFRMDELLSPDDIRKLAQIIAAIGELAEHVGKGLAG